MFNNPAETEFKEIEPGLNLVELPTVGSNLNHRFKFFLFLTES